MIGFVDRIEDGEVAVIKIRGGGELVIPVVNLPIKVYEGACLQMTMVLDLKTEKEQKKKIRKLQLKLLRKNEQK